MQQRVSVRREHIRPAAGKSMAQILDSPGFPRSAFRFSLPADMPRAGGGAGGVLTDWSGDDENALATLPHRLNQSMDSHRGPSRRSAPAETQHTESTVDSFYIDDG